MARTKTAILSLRIEPSIKEAAERIAAEDRRSLTAYVEKLMIDDIKKRGYLSQEGKGK